MVGNDGDGDRKHVYGRELRRSSEISQQSMEELIICCPGPMQRDGPGTAWFCPSGFQCRWDGRVICSMWDPRQRFLP